MIGDMQLERLARDAMATAAIGESGSQLAVIREVAFPDLTAKMYQVADTGCYVLAAAGDSEGLVLFATLQLAEGSSIAPAYQDRRDYAWSALVGASALSRLQRIIPEADRGFGSYEAQGDAAAAMALQLDRGVWEGLGEQRDLVFEQSVHVARDEYRLARDPATWKPLLLVAILEAPAITEEDGVTYVAAAESGDLAVLAKRVVSTA
ncbi:MAG: hypothetical protein M3M96_09145 [Candidatus Eremiobacteraeota bacterium]|nr:hypothetical protein [Candidatus Eremiobacteraeota bacterium]